MISSAVSESRGDEAHHEDESVLSALKGAFTSVSAWLFTATSVALFIPVYCFYSYSPTIVSRLMDGRISVRIQLTVIVPVYILACISNFACGYTSDKLRNRSIFIVGGTGLAILGKRSFYCWLIIAELTVVRRPLPPPDLVADSRRRLLCLHPRLRRPLHIASPVARLGH